MSYFSNAQINLPIDSIQTNKGVKLNFSTWNYTSGISNISDVVPGHSVPDAYELTGSPNTDTIYSPIITETSSGSVIAKASWGFVNYQETNLPSAVTMSLLVDGVLVSTYSTSPIESNNWSTANFNAATLLPGTHTVQFYFTNLSLNPAAIDDMGLMFVPASILPISINSFTSKVLGNEIVLNWYTTSESNNKGFDLERSNDQGATFNTVEFETSKGNSNGNLSYSFIDASHISGDNYYRLKQIDLDGKTTYSTIVLATINDNATVSVFPNPAINNLGIRGTETGAIIKIISMGSGQLISSTILSSPNIDISGLLSGIYSLQIVSSNRAQTIKFVKK